MLLKMRHFLKGIIRTIIFDDVWNLPTINKQIMMENLSDYNTLNFTKEELLNFLADIERNLFLQSRLIY